MDSLSRLTETWAPTGRQLLELQARVDVLDERVRNIIKEAGDFENQTDRQILAIAESIGSLRAEFSKKEENRQTGRYVLAAAWVTAICGGLFLVIVAIIQLVGSH